MSGQRRSQVALRAAAILLVVVAGLTLTEAGARALVKVGLLGDQDGEFEVVWPRHPEFGAWHLPNARGEHVGACFRSLYETNSVGARDVERPARADGPRVVVLGDSFLEGYGLEAASRMSNVLEKQTGVPHLNFAMAGFGPYQQLLVYRSLARGFDHTAVIASVFPANDFADLDPADCAALGDPEYCHRPFPGALPEMAPRYRRESALRSFLKRDSTAFRIGLAAWNVRRRVPYKPESRFYAYEERQVRLLEAVLDRLRLAVAPRHLIVVLIPHPLDIEVHRERGPDPLSEELATWAERGGVRVVNLLPILSEASARWEPLYLSCDFHWSHYGNRVAAEAIRREVPDLYGSVAAR
jgi:hypothetical protein